MYILATTQLPTSLRALPQFSAHIVEIRSLLTILTFAVSPEVTNEKFNTSTLHGSQEHEKAKDHLPDDGSGKVQVRKLK
jgi:hypothetical protein